MWLFKISSYKLLPSISTILPKRDFNITPYSFKGHSKWDNIKGTKGKKDAEKSKNIAAFLEKLKSVVKDGFDPKLNKKLASLQQDYMKKSLPMDTFNKRLDKLKVNLRIFFIINLF